MHKYVEYIDASLICVTTWPQYEREGWSRENFIDYMMMLFIPTIKTERESNDLWYLRKFMCNDPDFKRAYRKAQEGEYVSTNA